MKYLALLLLYVQAAFATAGNYRCVLNNPDGSAFTIDVYGYDLCKREVTAVVILDETKNAVSFSRDEIKMHASMPYFEAKKGDANLAIGFERMDKGRSFAATVMGSVPGVNFPGPGSLSNLHISDTFQCEEI